jgi:hypothetical protein
MVVTQKSTVTLILPNAQGIASERVAMAGMMVHRRRGTVIYTPVDARLAQAQLTALHVMKVSR